MIRWVDGSWSAKVEDVVWLKVLHANRLGDAFIERLANLQTGLLLKDRSQDIEVPVVVVPKGPRSVTTARRTILGHRRSFKIDEVIHTRSCAQQIHDPRL